MMNEYTDFDVLYPNLKHVIFIEDNNPITINWDELKRNLYNEPFTTWELVKTWLNTKAQCDQVRDQCEVVCVNVLTDLARNSKSFDKFYTLLSTCSEISDKRFNFSEILCKNNLEHEDFVLNLYLVLLGSKRFGLIKQLDDILTKYYAESNNVLNFEAIVLNAIQRHEHFVEKFIVSGVDESSIDGSEFYNKLLFCKLIYILNNEETYSINIRTVRSQINAILPKIKPDLLDSSNKSYFHEISRQMYLLTNVILKSTKVYDTYTLLTDLLNESNIIKLLIKLDINLMENRHVFDYITKHFEYKREISEQQTNTELEIYNEFVIISKYIEIMQLDDTKKNYLTIVTDQLNVIKKKFRQIDNFSNFIQLLENCFVLIFMRTEYNRFVCSKFVILEKILNSLDFIITQNKHVEKYQIDDAELKERFNRIIGYISDGLWRLSIFVNKTNSDLCLASDANPSIVIKNNNIKYILSSYKIAERTNNSSDDDEEARDENKMSKYRRVKPRKRRSLQRSGSDKINNPNNNITTSSNGEAIPVGKSDLTEYCCQDPNHDDKSSNSSNNIIVKMLSSVETLAVICMNRGDFTTVRQIIQKFKMESTKLSNEIYLTDHFVQTKLKLAKIFKKYDEQDLSNSIIQTSSSTARNTTEEGQPIVMSKSPPGQSTIQIIKNAAAIGLEVTKITNIIENFINLHRITQTPDVIDLIAKYRNNYSFLSYYIGDSLQISYIIDIMLSLSTSYDICLILYNLINKYYNHNVCDNDPNDNKIGRFDNIGYYSFIKRIIENLSVYKKYRPSDNVTVETLLLNEVYSFDLASLEFQLEIERFINSNNNCDNSNVLVLNSNAYNLLSKINNFYGNATKLLQYFDGDDRILNLDELLNVDFNRKIGEIIFGQNVEVEKIEEIVSLMNFNLIYVITINCVDRVEINLREDIDFCKLSNRLHSGEFCDPDGATDLYELNDTKIINYVSNKNLLISYLLANIFGVELGEEMIIKNSHLFQNFAQLKTIRTLSRMFRGENKYLTVLNWGSFSFNRIVSKFLLDRTIELPIKLKVLQNLKQFRELSNLIDIIVAKLIDQDPCANFPLIEKITNLNNKCDILIKNIYQIENINLINNYMNLIRYDRHLHELDHNLKSQLDQFAIRINIYNKIGVGLNINWKTVSELSVNQPEMIIEKLLIKNHFELLLEWCTIHTLTNYSLKFKRIISLFSIKLFEYNYNNDYDLENVQNLLKIIEHLPAEIILKFYKKNLLKIKNIYIIKYLLEYLKSNDRYYNDNDYSNILISLRIFEILLNLSYDNIDNLFLLFNSPLLIIEQFLMNSKFDLLHKIIVAVRKMIAPNAKCMICDPNVSNFGYDVIQYYRKNKSSGSLEGLHENVDYLHANIITNECIDLLLRIYATKSLDFRIIIDNNNSLTDLLSNSLSQSLLTIDSIQIEKFIMPKTPPLKQNWINDSETSLCMCCKRSIFTLLTRRHHCRRCGRVVCHSCSTSRMKIPNIYDNIFVRFCDDCYRQTEAANAAIHENSDTSFKDDTTDEDNGKLNKFQFWELYGNLKHDNIVREEFSYEFAPSVPLCLSILSNHVKSNEYSQFLLHHCRKFESLLRPIHNGYTNPEIDYKFVTRLLHCLALAAKVYGSESSIECSEMIDRVEVLLTIVQNDCQYLLPMEPLNSNSIRKLCDNLVLAEKWNLALELSLKCGLNNTGVMAAWGISCLRSGCYETAREKFTHCMVRLTVDENNTQIINILDTEPITNIAKLLDNLEEHVVIVKRPQKSPPLLYEIIKIMEQQYRSSNFMSALTLERAKSAINSNASLKTKQLNKREYNIPSYEPAINILNTLETLKQTAQANYVSTRKISKTSLVSENSKTIITSRYYEEAMYYLTTYGSHTDIIKFLIKHKQHNSALTYILIQKCDPEIFIATIILPHLKSGQMPRIIKLMIEYSDTLVIWRDYFIKTCRFLESKGMLNSLYQIQMLLNDPVRASMTCVKFFSMNCQSFKDLQNNLHHLNNAQQHLQTELELCQWVEIKTNTTAMTTGRMNSSTSTTSSSKSSNDVTFIMKLDSKTLNNHITTILRQIEVTKFLFGCESGGINIIKILSDIFKDYNCAVGEVPTLFNSVQAKIQLSVLVLVCGKNIEEGFGLAYRIIQDFNLNSNKIYVITARYLASNNRILEVEKLIDCIRSNNGTAGTLNCDEIIALSIQIGVETYGTQIKSSFENLMKLIVDKSVKINCHIACGQLKTAYLLAVQTNRLNDIKKIRKQAEQTNQSYIVKLCEKKLNSLKI